MTKGYIKSNNYRYRYFKSPLGFIKFLLDVFIDPTTGYINIVEQNLVPETTEKEIMYFAESEVKRIEALV